MGSLIPGEPSTRVNVASVQSAPGSIARDADEAARHAARSHVKLVDRMALEQKQAAK
jgi:hypothetical protein